MLPNNRFPEKALEIANELAIELNHNYIVCDSDLIFLISDTISISSSVCISTLLNVTGYIILVFVKKIKN